jgi:hypothetical protein
MTCNPGDVQAPAVRYPRHDHDVAVVPGGGTPLSRAGGAAAATSYYVASDLDGTLLDDEGRLTPYAATVLDTLLDAGHVLVFATARPAPSARRVLGSLSQRAYLITANGAELYGPGDAGPVRTAYISQRVAVGVLASLREILGHEPAWAMDLPTGRVLGPAWTSSLASGGSGVVPSGTIRRNPSSV